MIWLYSAGLVVALLGISAFFGAPYVPTRRRDLKRMFDELLPLSADDVVLDFGSGDGVVLREVSRRGARAIGYEIHPLFAGLSKLLSWGDVRVKVCLVNAWIAPFPSDVTAVYAFAVGRDSQQLINKMQREVDRLGRPLRLVCYGNPLPGRQPTQTFEAYALYHFQPLHLGKA